MYEGSGLEVTRASFVTSFPEYTRSSSPSSHGKSHESEDLPLQTPDFLLRGTLFQIEQMFLAHLPLHESALASPPFLPWNRRGTLPIKLTCAWLFKRYQRGAGINLIASSDRFSASPYVPCEDRMTPTMYCAPHSQHRWLRPTRPHECVRMFIRSTEVGKCKWAGAKFDEVRRPFPGSWAVFIFVYFDLSESREYQA